MTVSKFFILLILLQATTWNFKGKKMSFDIYKKKKTKKIAYAGLDLQIKKIQ